MPLLVIPYKDANELIQACQIRLHANDIWSDEKRYLAPSPLERHGTSSGTPIHFTCLKQKLFQAKQCSSRFRSNAHVIATSGVRAPSQLVTAARPYTRCSPLMQITEPSCCVPTARQIDSPAASTIPKNTNFNNNEHCLRNALKRIDDALRGMQDSESDDPRMVASIAMRFVRCSARPSWAAAVSTFRVDFYLRQRIHFRVDFQ
jgi:hypothetical protein